MSKATIYSEADYSGEFNLLSGEKRLIIGALDRNGGNVKRACRKLCPNDLPYTYNGLLRVIKRHSIDLGKIKDQD